MTKGHRISAMAFGAFPNRHIMPKSGLYVEFKVEDVTVLDDIGLAFLTQFAVIACTGFTAKGDEIVIGDGFGLDETAFKIGMDHTGGIRCGCAGIYRPCTRFFRANREEGQKVKQLVALRG